MDPEQKAFATRLGKRVRQLREAQIPRMSRDDLAEKCGLGAGFIRDVEQGVKRPMFDNAIKIADALGVTCRELHNFDGLPMDVSPSPRGRPKKPADDATEGE